MDIRAILLKLDPGNDDHWTGAGLPAVGAVGELLGEAVTRQQIAEAMPGFDRASANARLSFKDDEQQDKEPPEAPKDGKEQGLTGEGEKDEGEAQPETNDALAMIEAALSAAQSQQYMRNYELQAFVRQWQIQQTLIYESQRRIDKREADRASKRETK